MASLFVVLAYSVCRCQSEQKQMILTIEMDSLVLTEGDEAEIRLRIHGITSKINSYTFRLEYEMTSKFRKQRMRKKKNIVWNPQEGDSITLSEMITECDSYHIQICSVSWEDLTGMYKVKKEFNKQISFLVMPKRYEMGSMQEKIARRDLMEQGFEYDGVRKYQEGDRISRVHWNLYAATGGLWVRKNEEEEEEYYPREFDIDFTTGKLTGKIAEGARAIAVWAYLAIKIVRYKYIQYSWEYGNEMVNLIGGTYSDEYVKSEVNRMLTECLEVNPYVNGIENLEIEKVNETLHIKFTLLTDYGSEEVESDV